MKANAIKSLQGEINLLMEQPLLKKMETAENDLSLTLEESSRKNINLLLDLNHRLLTSRLMLEACLFREESRGGHFRIDAPAPLPQWERHSRQQKDINIQTRTIRL